MDEGVKDKGKRYNSERKVEMVRDTVISARVSEEFLIKNLQSRSSLKCPIVQRSLSVEVVNTQL